MGGYPGHYVFCLPCRAVQTNIQMKVVSSSHNQGRVHKRQTRKQLVATTSRTKWVHTHTHSCVWGDAKGHRSCGPAGEVGTGAAEVGWKCERTLVSDYKLFILFAKQVKSFHLAQDICTGPLPSETKVDLISKPGTWDRKKSKCILARNKHIYFPYQLTDISWLFAVSNFARPCWPIRCQTKFNLIAHSYGNSINRNRSTGVHYNNRFCILQTGQSAIVAGTKDIAEHRWRGKQWRVNKQMATMKWMRVTGYGLCKSKVEKYARFVNWNSVAHTRFRWAQPVRSTSYIPHPHPHNHIPT